MFLDGLTEELEAWAPATQYPHTNYHLITHREDLKEGARKIEAFLTYLAMAGTVSPSSQNQAMNALVFVRNEPSLPQKVRELAMLTTARAKDCPYIWNAHVRLGRQAGLSDALINALRDRESLPPMSVKEVVVIKLGIEFFQTNRVNQGAFDAALEQFGPQGLVELTTLMGQPQFDQAGCSPASPGTGGGHAAARWRRG